MSMPNPPEDEFEFEFGDGSDTPPGGIVHRDIVSGQSDVPAAPERLFDSRLLERYGVVDEKLDRRLAPLAQLRCMQTSERVQRLLQDTRGYNVDGPQLGKDRMQGHNFDQGMLERILEDVKSIRALALKAGTVDVPKKRFIRKYKEKEERQKLQKRLGIKFACDMTSQWSRDASRNYDNADQANLAIAPNYSRLLMADGSVMDGNQSIEVINAVNELMWKLDGVVKKVQTQKL